MTLQTAHPLAHHTLDAQPRQAREIARMGTSGELVLDPPYQRGSVWTTDQRRNLVRSWLLGVPVPAIVLNDRGTAAWEGSYGAREHVYAVIDGKQRIEAAIAWFDGDLDVPASWFDPDLVERTQATPDGPYVTASDLTTAGRRITSHRAMVPVCVAQVADLATEAAIFGLVNGAGVPQEQSTLDRAHTLSLGQDVRP